jgi:protein-L-isoaspartate(D-aspartate) O-methyltransferase
MTGGPVSDAGVRRVRMVDEQLVGRGLRDEAVLAAMRSVPRHLFVPPYLDGEAYADTPLPIGYGQTISQPYMVALMTALLRVDVRSRVLEIGSGSGYQTAVLAEVAGEVFAVELLAPLAERARGVLARLGYGNVHAAIADGTRGWPEEAPFDGILVAAASKEAPHALLEQLVEGGRLVLPLGDPHRDQVLTVFQRTGDSWSQQRDTGCRFVPLLRDGEPEVVTGGRVAAGAIPSRDRTSYRIDGSADRAGEEEAPAMKTVSVRVSGAVQGVYFRASAAREGERFGLDGWVSNERDGSVSLLLQGAIDAVDAMLAWCRVGPPAARVDRVEVADAKADDALRGFEVR